MDKKAIDLNMINNVDLWSAYPVLPLVRRLQNQPLECGFIVASSDPIIYKGNIFGLKNGLLGPQLLEFESVKYPSFEEILDDGWEVD